MDGGPPRFGPGFTCPALLRDRVAPSGLGSRTGLSPAAAGPPMPFRSPAGPAPGGGSPRMRGPATPSAEPLPGMPARRFGHRSPFARRYSGSLEIDFLSSGYLDVSVPRVASRRPMYSACRCWARPQQGSPIRRSAGRRMCAPRRGLSQLAASFIGSLCQGIRRAPVVSCGTASGPRDIHVSLINLINRYHE